MFVEGFEKEAGLKHWATAAMMAASPSKAKASSSVMDALKTTGSAVQKTQIGQQASANVNQYLKKAQNIKLFGNSGGERVAGASAGASAAAKSRAKPSLYLKDGNKLELDYGKFRGSADPKGLKANYDIGKGFNAEASHSGGENKASLFWKKDF